MQHGLRSRDDDLWWNDVSGISTSLAGRRSVAERRNRLVGMDVHLRALDAAVDDCFEVRIYLPSRCS